MKVLKFTKLVWFLQLDVKLTIVVKYTKMGFGVCFQRIALSMYSPS